eukprot:GHUV01037679.1.p1 GENE.GHUV01037679.1~~GHUV01037679.1.p1  ORF type:complete len:120 (-),score=21.80 GHUV01037679.1:40-399(-)
MLHHVESEQGRLVPRCRAAGHAYDGVYYIATERIDGHDLSAYESGVPEPVAAAALAALRALGQAFPGFLHGDIRLQNVLLVSDDSDAKPRCMWVDLGRSSMNGSKRQQLAEHDMLKTLL